MEQDEATEDENKDSGKDSDINMGQDDGNESNYIPSKIRGSRRSTGVSHKPARASNPSKTFMHKQGTKDSCEGGRQKKKNLAYEFCPLPHQPSILHLLTKHFCLHPLLPECHGELWTADHIHHDSVHEIYLHCKRNHLCEVWAYLWTNWYTPEKWRLWVQSAYPHAIPQKWTTMVVKAMWWNFKCLLLYLHNCLRVDFATFALVTQALPAYRYKLFNILNNPHEGWPSLCGEQILIKKAWDLLYNREIRGNYNMNVGEWRCSCGQQKYHLYLLCKHLIKAVKYPEPNWWVTVVQCHVLPFYDIHDLLLDTDQLSAPEPEELGNCSWLARMPNIPVGTNVLAMSPLLVCTVYFWWVHTDLYCIGAFLLTFLTTSHRYWQHAMRDWTKWFFTGK